MRKILYLFLFSFGLAGAVQAQTPPQEEPPAQEAPAKEASKAEPSDSAEAVKDGIDLEGFFKKGEENAKNGASCNKPATPADPIA